MGTFVAILFFVIWISLFVLAKKGVIRSDTIQLATNLAGILAFVVATLVFIIPTAQANNISQAPTSADMMVVASATTTNQVDLLPISTMLSPTTSIFPSPTIPSSSPSIIITTPTISSILVESDHPYADNYQNLWTVSVPGINQIRIHFSKLEISRYDEIFLLNKDGKQLKKWCCNKFAEDMWTEWYAGDTINIKLTTSGGGDGYGFAVDAVETREESKPPSNLPETYHPYADNYKETWVVSVPGANQIRIHFSRLEVLAYDSLYLFDKDDRQIKEWCCNVSFDDGLWTEWYGGDTIKLWLETSGGVNGYGFKVDQVETR